MNSQKNHANILQERFGLKAASYLAAGASGLPYEISERLRAARMQAVSKRKVSRFQAAGGVMNSGRSAVLGWGSDDGLNWWSRVGLVLPLIALVVGLLTINSVQNDNRAQEIAEVDSALLTDELPPSAFADAGFIQFLKATR